MAYPPDLHEAMHQITAVQEVCGDGSYENSVTAGMQASLINSFRTQDAAVHG